MYTSCDDDGCVWGCPSIRTSDYFERAHRKTVASVAHPFIHSFVRRIASRRAVPSSSSREVVASFSSSPRGDARRRDVVMTRATDGTDDDDVERGSTTRPTSATPREDDDDAETSARETREESGDDVRALDDAMAGFSLGTSGNGRGTRGRGARRRRGGGGRADAARERDVDARERSSERGEVTWGAFVERLGREGGRESPKKFELREIPARTESPRRRASAAAAAADEGTSDGGSSRVARSLNASFESDGSSEMRARASEVVTTGSPEPMTVDSPNDSDASEAFAFTPPSTTTFSMGQSNKTSSGSMKKSASFRARARAMVAENAQAAETTSNVASSPPMASPTPKQFTFSAPPPDKSHAPPTMRPKPAETDGGAFKMGSDDSPTSRQGRNSRYAQRAHRDRRSAGGAASNETPKFSTRAEDDLTEAASKMTLDSLAPRDAEETEKLRQEGNALYRQERYAEADAAYSRALSVFASAPRTNAREDDQNPLGESIDTFVGREAAVLLTNRAAARMMIPVDGADAAGEARVRTLKALVDCERAVRADETYNRARVRLATCHMKLADFDAALACLEAAPEPNDADIANAVVEARAAKGHLDKVLGAAVEFASSEPGLPRLYSDARARELDEKCSSVVKSVAALSAYPFLSSNETSGRAYVQVKASILLACGAYQEASAFVAEIDGLGLSDEPWVPQFAFMAMFGRGDPQGAVKFAETAPAGSLDEDVIETARAMTRDKDEGNRMFNANKYTDAVAAYTKAFDAGKSPVSAAYCSVVLGNRAAAYQGLDEVLNALADCGRALAFNPWNIKALSRRATLHETVRCWDEAIKDLNAYVEIAGNEQYDLFANQLERKNALAVATDRLRGLRTKKETQPNAQMDMYRIMGLGAVKSRASESDIKKAYRNLALKYHPDKANRNMPAWTPANELHDDADRLFKLIGETNAQLSDPALRSVYDESERIRAVRDRQTQFTRSNTWSAPSNKDFQFGQDVHPWMSPPGRRAKSRMNRSQSGKNYYWNF